MFSTPWFGGLGCRQQEVINIAKRHGFDYVRGEQPNLWDTIGSGKVRLRSMRLKLSLKENSDHWLWPLNSEQVPNQEVGQPLVHSTRGTFRCRRCERNHLCSYTNRNFQFVGLQYASSGNALHLKEEQKWIRFDTTQTTIGIEKLYKQGKSLQWARCTLDPDG